MIKRSAWPSPPIQIWIICTVHNFRAGYCHCETIELVNTIYLMSLLFYHVKLNTFLYQYFDNFFFCLIGLLKFDFTYPIFFRFFVCAKYHLLKHATHLINTYHILTIQFPINIFDMLAKIYKIYIYYLKCLSNFNLTSINSMTKKKCRR